MRLSSSPATAVCVAASLCLAATTTEAFFVPSASLRVTPLSRGQRGTCSRCVGPAAVKMATMKGNASNPSQPDTRRRTPLVNAARLFARRRGTAAPAPNASQADTSGPREVVRGGHRQRRARDVARRGFAAVATAVIVRSTFRAQPASAIMPKLRGTSAQQQMIEKAHREEKQAAIRERMAEEQQEGEGLESPTSELDGQAIGGGGEEGAAAAEGGGAAGGDSAGAAQASAAVAKKTEPPVQRKLTRKQRTAMMREKFDAKGFDPNTYPIKKADAGTFGAVIMGSFALYNIVSSFKGSTDVMGNQRRRVKVEGAKFDQQKEEFMNVDGEAEVDVDIMKELRDMKEKMAGPGDKYAKDTRKYNPDFAAEHPEDEYDNKIEEILRKSGKKGKTSKTGKTGIVFASDDSTAANDELLGEEGGDNEDNDNDNDSDSDSDTEAQSEADASAAMKAKKDADVKRLQDLFNSSPSEDGDTPEDDIGEKRDLLP